MTRSPYYVARAGLIWSPTSPYTVKAAEEHARDFLDMALSERDGVWSARWVEQLADLVAAIREARVQCEDRPVEPEGPPDFFAVAASILAPRQAA